jgi:T-complex protein 1 subunit zeta
MHLYLRLMFRWNTKKRKNFAILALITGLKSENFLSEVNSGFFYKSAEEREKLVAAERAFTDEKVKKIIELKKKVCNTPDKGFVLINQKVKLHFYYEPI